MKAIALLSGGADSATAYFFACALGEREVTPLFFDYGQKTLSKERECAKALAEVQHATLREVYVKPPSWWGSEITTQTLIHTDFDLPKTFLPGRNIIQLSYAGALAKTVGAEEIYGGWNSVDYGGYPDCRESFMENMEWALREGLDYGFLRIKRPLMEMKKSSIILMGTKLKVPFELTWSCYFNTQKPCMECDSCKLRAKAFKEAEIEDPIIKEAQSGSS